MSETTTEKMVQINVISTRGHDVLEMSSRDALAEVSRQAKSNAKWVFLNGELVSDLSDLTLDRIESASDVTLSNALVGG